jgi:hypothetical protein
MLTESFRGFLQSLRQHPAPSHCLTLYHHLFPKFTRYDITRQNAVILSRSPHTLVFCFRAIFRTLCVVLYRFLCRVVCQMCYCSSKMTRLCHFHETDSIKCWSSWAFLPVMLLGWVWVPLQCTYYFRKFCPSHPEFVCIDRSVAYVLRPCASCGSYVLDNHNH